MKLTREGLLLIKSHEGLRLQSYPDPATGGEPWTIGFGHTSAAGKPLVSKGMKITEEEAEAILLRDLKTFENEVKRAVKVPLTDPQFSALVSFCYNVGGANFRKSGVLAAVNEKRFDVVPARLLLWNKANGKVLKGLTRRRAEESKMFAEGSDHADDAFVTGAEPPKGKSAIQSSTIISQAGVIATSVATPVISSFSDWKIAAVFGAILVIGLAIYTISERLKHSQEAGV